MDRNDGRCLRAPAGRSRNLLHGGQRATIPHITSMWLRDGFPIQIFIPYFTLRFFVRQKVDCPSAGCNLPPLKSFSCLGLNNRVTFRIYNIDMEFISIYREDICTNCCWQRGDSCCTPGWLEPWYYSSSFFTPVVTLRVQYSVVRVVSWPRLTHLSLCRLRFYYNFTKEEQCVRYLLSQ